MINFLKSYCSRISGVKVRTDKIGNIFITKGQSETYPCIVAHMDQVQRLHPKDFVAIETRDLIFGYSASTRQQCGLGADDKNGIWIALKCLEKYPAIKIAFFMGEEIGCVGSFNADIKFFEDTRFVIQCDRKGYNDLITDICGISLCSQEFLDDIDFQQFGYHKEHGMTTDVGALKEKGLPVSCINLSCGYYEPHTDQEFTIKADLKNCLHLVEHIIEKCTNVYPHEYVDDYPAMYPYFGGEKKNEYDELYCELWDILDNNPNASLAALKKCYKEFYPNLTDSDIDELYAMVKEEIESYQKYEHDYLGKI